MLIVSNLSVAVGGRVILRDVSFSVGRGEVFYVLGPNGVGKSSLLKALLGIPGYETPTGVLKLDGVDLTNKKIEERTAAGLALAFQNPPRLHGVRVGTLLSHICRKSGCDPVEVAESLELRHLWDREVGRLSGGEGKRLELATVAAMRPKAALIDEPDSGVDVDSLALVGRALKNLLETAALVVVTHSGYITKYVPPSRACVILGGVFKKCGSGELVEEVLAYGFTKLA